MSNVPMIEEPFFATTESGKLLAHNSDTNESILLEIFAIDSNPNYYVTIENMTRQDGLVFFDFVFELRNYPEKRFTAGTMVMTERNYEGSPLSWNCLPTHFAFMGDGAMDFCAVRIADRWYALNGFMSNHDFPLSVDYQTL